MPLEANWLSALLMGLFGALHCLGMCGSITGVLTLSLPSSARAHTPQLTAWLGLYNLGRLTSYTLAGAIAGGFGHQILLRISPEYGHTLLLILASVLMIATGFYLAGWFPRLAYIERIGAPIWKKLEPIGSKLLPVRSPLQAVLYGMVWGWLPCGLVYSALFLALAQGQAMQGALFMLFFGIGTLPSVVGTGYFAGHLLRFSQHPQYRRYAGALLIFLALAGLVSNWWSL